MVSLLHFPSPLSNGQGFASKEKEGAMRRREVTMTGYCDNAESTLEDNFAQRRIVYPDQDYSKSK